MEEHIKASFGKLWPTHMLLLSQFLSDCRTTFDGDLELLLVLTVIGERTFSKRHADPTLTFEQFTHGAAEGTPSLEINMRSISDSTGIPRETVRRKVQELISKKWVEKRDDGSLLATPLARAELEPLTLATIKYLSRVAQLVRD